MTAFATRPVGLLGLGLLGSALADRLLSAGFSVVGFDVDPLACEALRRVGGSGAPSAVAVVDSCRRVLLCLPDSRTVAEAMEPLGNALRPGSVVVDTSTGAPEDSVTMARTLATLGVHYLDATIGGSSRQVRAGEAIVMCGGPVEVFHECNDLFASFCTQSFHLGPPGSGAHMKLVMNLVLGLQRLALAEGLSFVEAAGVDPALALRVLKASPAHARVMDEKGDKMVRRDFAPAARLSQHLKDVRLILASAAKTGAELPVTSLHRQLLEGVEAAGLGAADNSAIVTAFAALRGRA